MPLARINDAPVHEFMDTTFRSLAVPSRGTSQLAMWRATIPPASTAPAHSHDQEVIYMLLSGSVTGTYDGEELTAGPGDAIILPANALASFSNPSATEPAEVLVCTSAGMKVTLDDQTFQTPWSL